MLVIEISFEMPRNTLTFYDLRAVSRELLKLHGEPHAGETGKKLYLRNANNREASEAGIRGLDSLTRTD
jgi:hypothetical protein